MVYAMFQGPHHITDTQRHTAQSVLAGTSS